MLSETGDLRLHASDFSLQTSDFRLLFCLCARGELDLDTDRVRDGKERWKIDRPDTEVAQEKSGRGHAGQHVAGKPGFHVEDLSLGNVANGEVARQPEIQLAAGGVDA